MQSPLGVRVALSLLTAMIAVAGVSALASRPGVARMDTWQELSALAEKRLKAVSSGERGVFAAGVAERLMSWHEALPEDEQAPFTVSLRPLLNSVWEGVLGDPTAFSAVKRGVAEYMLSEYCHNDGQDGPDEADESAAAAALHAAHAYLFGCQDFAIWTSSRAVEAIDQRLQYLAEQDGDEHLPDPDEALAAELQRQLRDLDLITRYSKDLRYSRMGLGVDTSIRLRVELRAPLSSQSME
ncbi:hypothetical protein [Streptomyces mirabilis]|uniref:hypothetical protein n=2 Tax=Streptomyces mirabilis TaxID=68239 RepID=UPI0036DD5C59